VEAEEAAMDKASWLKENDAGILARMIAEGIDFSFLLLFSFIVSFFCPSDSVCTKSGCQRTVAPGELERLGYFSLGCIISPNNTDIQMFINCLARLYLKDYEDNMSNSIYVTGAFVQFFLVSLFEISCIIVSRGTIGMKMCGLRYSYVDDGNFHKLGIFEAFVISLGKAVFFFRSK